MTSPKHHIALYAALAVLATIAFVLFKIATTVALIVLGVVLVTALVLAFNTSARTAFFSLIGVPVPTSLSDILGDLNTLVSDLEQKAKDLIDEAEGHKQIAAVAAANAETATAQAVHAAKVADNVKTLVAP